MKKIKSNENGVTLVALVITIMVLLILATVSIAVLLGDNGIIAKSKEAKQKTDTGVQKSDQKVNTLIDEFDKTFLSNNNETGGGDTPVEPENPGGLDVGSEVIYQPSGTYEWKHKYCSSTKAEKASDGTTDAFDLLESGTYMRFDIPIWKVLSIDEATGKVELVPRGLTPEGVYLGEAQGYNNGVKLLNDACSKLYGNSSKGIEARSINIEDIEKYMTEEAKTGTEGVYNYIDERNTNTKYGSQVTNTYTSYKSYPVIYAYEKQSVINADPGKEKTLDLSDTQANFIERTTDSATDGNLEASTSIQPYQTYWGKNDSYMSNAFKSYTRKDGAIVNYHEIIMPEGANTKYWVASRCVLNYTKVFGGLGNCNFCVRHVNSGGVGACSMWCSNNSTNNNWKPLFPVVTLSSNLIEGDATSGFSVK